MAPTKHLDEVISAHILPIALRRHLIKIRDDESTRGALCDYTADNVYIRIRSDRGMIEIEVGSSAGNLRAVSFYKDLLSPAPLGRWNLSAQDACEFIDSNWDWFTEHFSEKKAQDTIERVDAHARRK
jgi:hypothetical protein